MTEREQFELIDRYFRGELSASEMETFQGLLATDNEFAEAVSNHEAINEVILDAGLLDIKEKLKTYTNNGHAPPKNKPLSSGFMHNGAFKLVTGALLLILVGLSFGIWYASSDANGPDNSESNPVVNKPTGNANDSSKNSEDNGKKKVSNENKPKVKDKSAPSEKISRDKKEAKNDESSSNSSAINHIDPSNAYFGNVSITNLKVNNSPASAPSKSIQLSENLEKQLVKQKCEAVDITGEVEAVPTCQEKANGKLKVKINSIKGGQEPYEFSFAKSSNFSKKHVEKNLSRGIYTVKVRDKNDCVETIAKGIRINEEECGNRSFTFVPEKETHWEYPFEQASPSGEIKIYYEGQQVYQDQVNNGIPKTWQGRFSSGQKAPMGLYRIIFNPTNAKAKMWLLTVIR